jgi:hypothetical protein
LDHAQDADHVGVEQRLRLADARFLDRPDQIDAGIVDQDIDPASAAAHVINAGSSRGLITNIERHEFDARERTRRRGCADATEDPIPAGGDELGGCPANAGRCAGNQDNTPAFVHHENSARPPQSRSPKDDQDHLLMVHRH